MTNKSCLEFEGENSKPSEFDPFIISLICVHCTSNKKWQGIYSRQRKKTSYFS